ncbi:MULTISPECIES: type VI secretion system accessory protein TagJ [Burkholderia]|uniref:type VI secretion system accessory protein TagJ n=1 Tax=Burkholderia TaxID=32008 RepID=UPI001B91F2D5|nr:MULTISPECIES: type VI secretion system accessory protein TagJ [Burkholderia]MBR8430090.1 ImpE/SciE family protein [Burkholderia cenocepacia]UVE56367.1 ImpE/SciE family protein [Burkholderia sp. EMB26]
MTRLTASHPPALVRLDDASLSEQIERISASVRAQPAIASHRWALFQLLCVMSEWARAIRQLQTWATLDPVQTATAQVYRDLIRAECRRKQVVDGHERPGFVFEQPARIDGLLNALQLAAAGRIDAADDAREAAFDAAPTVAARIPQGAVAWIVDSDSRFGPVCEIIAAGHYRWIPFADLASWRVPPPTRVIDLVWAPCTFMLGDGAIIHGFMPARYPGSEAGTDAVRVGRETSWQEHGRTGVMALGQKTWSTDRGDFGLFELATAEFGAGIGNSATTGEPTDE